MKAHSLELRRQVVDFVRAGGQKVDAVRRFGVSFGSIQTYQELDAAGNLAPKKTWRKISPEQLRRAMKKHPDATKADLARMLGVDSTLIGRYLKKMGLKTKKYQRPPFKFDSDRLRAEVKRNPGATHEELAKVLGVSPYTVTKRLQRLQIKTKFAPSRPARKFDPERLRREIQRNPDATREELATALDVTYGTVCKHIHAMGIPYARATARSLRRVRDEQFRREVRKRPGATLDDLAKVLGLCTQSVRLRMKRLQLTLQRSGKRLGSKADPKKLRRAIKQHPHASQKELAKMLGVGVDAVVGQLKRSNIQLERYVRCKVDPQELRQEVERRPDISIQQLAKKFGVRSNVITVHLRRLKISRVSPPPAYKIDIPKLQREVKKRPNATLAELAEALGVSRDTVCSHLKRLRIPKGNWLDPKRLQRELKKQPRATHQELADALGVSTSTITRHLLKLNIARPRCKISLEEFQRELAKRPNATLEELAKPFHVSRHTARELLRQLGLKAPYRRPPKLTLEQYQRELEKRPNIGWNELVTILGVGHSALDRYLKRWNIRWKRPRKVSLEKIRKFVERHPTVTLDELVKHYRVHRCTMKNYLKELHLSLTAPPHRFDPEKLRQEVEAHPHITQRALAKTFGVGRGTIRRHLRELNLSLLKKAKQPPPK